ncbi:MAG: M42 family metallopeptidase [Anaerolineae bacterium]|nr:M42 family metallopeptidase [Anaerolineae bacterium]
MSRQPMILKALSEARGVSGNEQEVRAIIRDAICDVVDEVKTDTIGNLLAIKRGTAPDPLRVMISAHMDEVGLMTLGHNNDGLLEVRSVGGLDPRVLPGSIWEVGPDRLPGVIGIKPIHLLKNGESEKVADIEDLFVDIGATSKSEAQKLAPVGTTITFATQYRELGPTVSGKAFDDRAGCAVLVELLRAIAPLASEIHAAFTVQEEVGLRGARVAAYAIQPECAFALEGTIADDLPKDKKDVSPTTELGKGPAITVMDRSFIADRRLLALVRDTASELEIPHQIKQPGVGGTDSGAIHMSREGVPSITLSVPCRYIHSPVALLNLSDFENTVRLLQESVMRLSRDTLRRE